MHIFSLYILLLDYTITKHPVDQKWYKFYEDSYGIVNLTDNFSVNVQITDYSYIIDILTLLKLIFSREP